MTAPTPQSPAREAVELPEPYPEWTAYAKRSGLLDENGVAPPDSRMKAQMAFYAYSAAWNRLYPLLAAKQEEVDKMREALEELLSAMTAEYPPMEAGREAQDTWSTRRAAAVDGALDLLARPTQGEAG